MKFWIGIILVLICSLWTVRSLWGSAYFPMHDDTQVARVVVMGRAILQGQFPVRWVSDLGYGYGYPIYNFYAPLPYYTGGLLYAMGVDSVIATKIMFGLGAILAALCCFLLLESVLGVSGGLIGSVLFVYAPYHAVQIYIRGAVGEYWAMAFVPLVIWGVLLAFQKNTFVKAMVVGGIGLTAVIVSHTILGFLVVAGTILGSGMYTVVSVIRKTLQLKTTGALLAITLVGLGLSAFFWLPALAEMKYTGVASMITGAPTDFSDHFLCIGQLWNSPWGYGGSAPGCSDDGMAFKLGKFQIIIAVTGIAAWIASRKRKKNSSGYLLMVVGVTLIGVSLFGMLGVSKPLWSIIPFASFIQYPWRLLSVAILAMGICSAFIVMFVQKPISRLACTVAVVSVCIAINAKLFHPQYQYMRDTKAFETPSELRFRVSQISDEYLPPGMIKPNNRNEIVTTPIEQTQSLHVQILTESDVFFRAEVDSAVMQKIPIRKAYFPGWQYRINGQKVIPEIAHGIPQVIVSKGKSIIELSLRDTPVRVWGNAISLLSIIVVSGMYLYGKKTNA